MERTICIKDHINCLNKLVKGNNIYEINKEKNKFTIQSFIIDYIIPIKNNDENLIWIKTLEEGDEGAGNRSIDSIFLTRMEARKAITDICIKQITYHNNKISFYINSLKQEVI